MRYHDPLKQILEKTRWYWDHDGMPWHVRAEFRKVLQCRTRSLGAEIFASENGQRIVPHTCKSRACPVCGYWATFKWQRERLAALPPVLYKGITFTMPKVLWHLFRNNRVLADALPALATDAMQAWILAKHGLRPGGIAILHTFNGKLEFNSHVHTMVTAGGWRVSSGSWIGSVYYNQDILTRLWRKSVLKLLRAALRSGFLTSERTPDEIEAILLEQECWWSVRIQSFYSVAHFLQYGGRYARRPPIAQRRITYIGKRTVQFWAKDKMSGKIISIHCSLEEFIDRWRQHILIRYRHAVRYFGLFAPRAVSKTFDAIFAAIGQKRQPKPDPLYWADSLKQMTGRDPLLDAAGQRMIWVGRLAPEASLSS
jgi:hypothetical protein